MVMISVIVPVYNISEYLPRCLDSILKQTYEDLEIILIDDGSTDESGKICDAYEIKDHRVKVIHKENGGVSSARNIGLDIAKGDYIGFVDGDDLLEERLFEILLKNAEKYQCDISCCQLATIDVDGTKKNIYDVKSQFFAQDYLIKHYFFDSFVKDTMYSQCNKIFKSTLIENIRYKQYKYGEDILFVFEALARSNGMFYDEYVGYYYLHRENSAMTTGFSANRIDYISAIREIEKICREKFPYATKQACQWVYQHTLICYRGLIINHLFDDFPETMKEYRGILKLNRNHCFMELPTKRKIDYILCMNFPKAYRWMGKK